MYLFVDYCDLVKDDGLCRENTAYNLGRGFCTVNDGTSNLGVIEGEDMLAGNLCKVRHLRQKIL